MLTLRRYLPPAALLVGAVGIWELAARTLGIERYILPAPSEIATALARDRSLLASDAWVTVREIALGFTIAVAAGLGVALLLHLSRALRTAAYPLLIASQTLPVIVLAPILVIMFGYDIRPKLAIVALICFFPIAVNALDGLRSVDRDLLKMMRSLDASRWSMLTRVELPAALPFAFSGAKVAASVAAIGAVFGEWVGSDAGLGFLMIQGTAQLQTARVFAAVVILTVIAVALFGLVGALERLAIPWSNPRRNT